jgi:hypothetical protein
MKNVDPDILAALKTVAADGDSQRVLQAHKRHDEHTQRRFETEMELLSEEVERVVPRTHPLFDLVLILAVARKMERKQQEPEFRSALEFPNNW